MHITNLSNVLFFSEKNKVFKKKNKTFSLKEQELFKIWPVVFSIMASTCRNSLFFLQIFQLLRKHPARRHSGWKIYIAKCFSRKISFRKNDSLRIRETPIRLKDSNPRLKHIPEPNPSAEMPTNKAFAGSLKDLKDFSRYSIQSIMNGHTSLKKVRYLRRAGK